MKIIHRERSLWLNGHIMPSPTCRQQGVNGDTAPPGEKRVWGAELDRGKDEA